MKRFAFLPVLLLLVGTSARAEEVGLLAQCERWSGGVYAEEEPTQWNKNGHGVEFKYFKGQDPEPGWVGLPFYRYEEDERIDNPHDDPVGWSAWIPVRGLFDG